MDNSNLEDDIELQRKLIKKKFSELKKIITKTNNSLTDTERKWLEENDTFFFNTPIHSNCVLIWLNEPFEYQWLICDYFDEVKVPRITILGPYKANNFIKRIKEELSEFQIPEKLIKNFIKFIESQEFFQKNEQCICGEISDVFIKGNIINYDIPSTVQDSINSALKKKPPSEKKGITVWLKMPNDSPFCFGDTSDILLEDRLQDELFNYSKVTEYVISDVRIAIFSDGSLRLFSQNNLKAKNIINAFISILNIKNDISFFPVDESDIHKIRLNSETMEDVEDWWKKVPSLIEIPSSIIRDSLKLSSFLLSHPELLQSYVLLLQSNNHIKKGDYSQSFHLSWVILEIHISHLWDRVLEENTNKINVSRKERLQRWSAYSLLETLNLFGKISFTDYEKISKWRRIRNDFVHKGKTIPLKECKEIYNFTKQILIDQSVQQDIIIN